MLRRTTIAGIALLLTAGVGVPLVSASAQETGSISGVAFRDMNRNASQDPGEAALVGHVIYLFDSAGSQLATSGTDAAGRYTFTALPNGSYTVQYRRSDWLAMRRDFVPSTTGSIRPVHAAVIDGAASVADFGWRPITRSTDSSAPLSTWTAPDGLTVKSYNDAVAAHDVDRILRTGSLIGAEARAVTIRLDITPSSFAATSVMGSAGSYRNFSATINLAWAGYLDDADGLLFHEYGHAWAGYVEHIIRQDGTLSGYLSRRGLLGDARLDSNHAWSRGEMLAEDYRQLFGSTAGRAGAQENTEITPAAQVDGLGDYLRGEYMGSPAPSSPASPSPTAAPSSPPAPSSTSPSPSPTPTATTKTRGGGGRK